jgi:phosphoribosylformylglycinamidine cyclo-ligase
MAHITGGGLVDNLKRILPPETDAIIDLSQLPIPTIFGAIREAGSIDDDEMLRTFNLGIGIVCVCAPEYASVLSGRLSEAGVRTRFIGEIQSGSGTVHTIDALNW